MLGADYNHFIITCFLNQKSLLSTYFFSNNVKLCTYTLTHFHPVNPMILLPVNRSAFNDLKTNISPEDPAFTMDKINSCCILQVANNN